MRKCREDIDQLLIRCGVLFEFDRQWYFKLVCLIDLVLQKDHVCFCLLFIFFSVLLTAKTTAVMLYDIRFV